MWPHDLQNETEPVPKKYKMDQTRELSRQEWLMASMVEDSAMLDLEHEYWQSEAMQFEEEENSNLILAAAEFAEHEQFLLRDAFWLADDIAWNAVRDG